MPYLIFGSIGVLVGTSIFFFLPLSVISFNIGMMLNIFFMILIGMIFGLTLIAFNMQRLIETACVYTMLFFEHKSMKILALKNLSAHRESNKLTSIIYSLTLGCIIFIVMAVGL